MTSYKPNQPLPAPHDALIRTEKLVLNYQHGSENEPFHPLEIIGFVVAGFAAVVLISVLIGRWYFDDPHKTPTKWFQQSVKLAPK